MTQRQAERVDIVRLCHRFESSTNRFFLSKIFLSLLKGLFGPDGTMISDLIPSPTA